MNPTASHALRSTTCTNGLPRSFGPDGCPAVVDGSRRCGETKNLQIINEFKRLYEDKMKQIDDIAGGDCIQAKVNLQQEWIKDLTDQNEMLVRVVEELEVEAAERVTLLEKKLQQSAKSAGEKEDLVKEQEKRIKELEEQLKPFVENGKLPHDYAMLMREYKELEQSMLDMRDALTAEVADKHDTVLCLRREVHLLEEECRKADQQTHFKDDIIKELRKEIKQLKLQQTQHHNHHHQKQDEHLKDAVTDIKKQLAIMKEQMDACCKERDSYKQQCECTREEFSVFKREQTATVKDLQGRLQYNLKQVEEYQQKLRVSNDELDSIRKECQYRITAEKDYKSKISECECQIATLLQEKQKLETCQNNVMLEEIEAFEEQHNETLNQLEHLRAELEKTKREHKLCMDKIKELGEENRILKERFYNTKNKSTASGDLHCSCDSTNASVNTDSTWSKSISCDGVTCLCVAVNTVSIDRLDCSTSSPHQPIVQSIAIQCCICPYPCDCQKKTQDSLEIFTFVNSYIDRTNEDEDEVRCCDCASGADIELETDVLDLMKPKILEVESYDDFKRSCGKANSSQKKVSISKTNQSKSTSYDCKCKKSALKDDLIEIEDHHNLPCYYFPIPGISTECKRLKFAIPSCERRSRVSSQKLRYPPPPIPKLPCPLKSSLKHQTSRKCTCNVECQTYIAHRDVSVAVKPVQKMLEANTHITKVCGCSVITLEAGTSMGGFKSSNSSCNCDSTTDETASSVSETSAESYEDTVLSRSKDQVIYVRQSNPGEDLETVVHDLNMSVSRIVQVTPEVDFKDTISRLEEQLRAALKQKEQAVEHERMRRNQEVDNLKLTIQHMENAIKNKQANSDNLQCAFVNSLKEEISRLKRESHSDSLKITGLKNEMQFYINQAVEVKTILNHILGIGDSECQIVDVKTTETLVITAQEVERFVQTLQSQINLMLVNLEREQSVNRVNVGRIDELEKILNMKSMETSRTIEMYQSLKQKLDATAIRNEKLEQAVLDLHNQLADTELDQQFQETKVDICHNELDQCLSNLNSVKLKLRVQCQTVTKKIAELAQVKAEFKAQHNTLETYKRDLDNTKAKYKDEVCELKRVIKDLSDKLQCSESKTTELNNELQNAQEIIVNMTQRESKHQQEMCTKEQDYNNRYQVWKVKESRLLEQISQLEQQLRAVHNELAGRTHQIDSAKCKLQQISNDAQLRVQMGQDELLAAKNEINGLRQVQEKLQLENESLHQTLRSLKNSLAQHESIHLTVKKQLDKCMCDLKKIEADKYFVEQKNEKLLIELDKMQSILRCRCENVISLEEELNEIKSSRDEIRKESQHVVCNVRAWLAEQKRINDQLKDKLVKKDAIIVKYQQASSSSEPMTITNKRNLPANVAEVYRQRGGTVTPRVFSRESLSRKDSSQHVWSLNSRGSDTESPRSSDCSDSAEWFDMDGSETTTPFDEPGTEVWIQRVESMTEELQKTNRYWKKKISDCEFMVTKDK